jgi:hypothetical protein
MTVLWREIFHGVCIGFLGVAILTH